MPGVSDGGFVNRNSLICCILGLIISKRNLRDSWNVIDPDIALFVLQVNAINMIKVVNYLLTNWSLLDLYYKI